MKYRENLLTTLLNTCDNPILKLSPSLISTFLHFSEVNAEFLESLEVIERAHSQTFIDAYLELLVSDSKDSKLAFNRIMNFIKIDVKLLSSEEPSYQRYEMILKHLESILKLNSIDDHEKLLLAVNLSLISSSVLTKPLPHVALLT